MSVATYVLLYRWFDRVMLQPLSQSGSSRWLAKWVGRAPVRHAIRRFVSITIRRSVLHQGLVVGLLAAAGGFVLNSLLSVNGWNAPLDTRLTVTAHSDAPVGADDDDVPRNPGHPRRAVRAARPALELGIPDDGGRRRPCRGLRCERPHRAWPRVVVPLALLGPVQWWVLGSSAAGIIALEALIGWLVVEWVMADWCRIPFTCSYIPGKGFVPHMFVKGFASSLFFTTITTLILRVSFARPRAALVVALIVGATAGALRLHRMRHAPLTPLMFDDELPMDIDPLRLNAD